MRLRRIAAEAGSAASPSAPAWVAVIAPVLLHVLGLAGNWLKHG